jgi:twitching motility protein PilT
MALVESLLTAIVRADGDALVMHVGERPYVVASTGPIELSAQSLNLQAMAGMTAHLLPPEAQRSLAEFGAVEHQLAAKPEMQGDRFSVVVARGGDDVWIEIRRHREQRTEGLTSPPVPEYVAAVEQATAPEAIESTDVPAPDVVTEHYPPAPVEKPASEWSAPAMAGSGPVAVARWAPAAEVSAAPRAESAPVAEAPADAPADAEPATPAPSMEAVAAAPDPDFDAVDAVSAISVSDHHHQVVEESTPHAASSDAAPVQAVGSHDLEEQGEYLNAVQDGSRDMLPEDSGGSEQETADGIASVESASTTVEDVQEIASPVPDAVATSFATAAEASAEAMPSYAAAEEPSVQVDTATEHRSEPATQYAAAAETSSSRLASPIGSGAGTPAAVIPMLRTLRIEVPPSGPSRHSAPRPEIERLLTVAAARGATALYLTTQASPYVRIDADVHVLDGEPPLSAVDVESAVLDLVPDTAREALLKGEPADWVSELADIGPVRCTTFRDHRGPGAIFQLISSRPTSAEHLGLAAEVKGLATEIEGLVLVASPRANGKTTVLGSLVDLINRQRPAYVITLERQIRVVHEHGSALISQREVRGTKEELLSVARSAVRENPDVLVIEDLSSPEMCQLTLDAAGSGVLVLASVTAGSTAAALNRLVDLFPADKRRGAQALFAERLRGAVAQVLLRKTGGGRVAAREVLLTTSGVASAIANGHFEELPQAIDTARKHGLVSLTEALVQLLREGAIDLREAYRKTDDRAALVAALKRENLETSLLERLA